MTLSTLAGTLPNLEAFCRTFETGSFSKAAQLSGVTPQATSRSVARLEHALGVTLFRRTTRSLSPTKAAREYYERCARALSLLSEGEKQLSKRGGIAEGQVRISVPTTYGHHRLLPALTSFAERYPKIKVDVGVSNQNVDLVRDGFDLAIRRGTIRDKTLVARKLGDFPLGVYASSAYLARAGTPKTLEELAQHECVTFVMPSSGRALRWAFAAGKSFLPEARYRCLDDPLAVIGLCRAGLGLVQVFDFLVEELVQRGELVEVLAPLRGPGRAFSLVYPKPVKRTPAVRALIDFIVQVGSAGRSEGRS
ncbi:MAG TPA: LysR substrate-binding domain-containing protein [Polyangiaceae bacterium]|nr:LysR substrate-binding domain-containing protein [Polyangiaceae bacterium]